MPNPEQELDEYCHTKLIGSKKSEQHDSTFHYRIGSIWLYVLCIA